MMKFHANKINVCCNAFIELSITNWAYVFWVADYIAKGNVILRKYIYTKIIHTLIDNIYDILVYMYIY